MICERGALPALTAQLAISCKSNHYHDSISCSATVTNGVFSRSPSGKRGSTFVHLAPSVVLFHRKYGCDGDSAVITRVNNPVDGCVVNELLPKSGDWPQNLNNLLTWTMGGERVVATSRHGLASRANIDYVVTRVWNQKLST